MKKISLYAFIAVTVIACKPDLPPLPSERVATAPKTTDAAKGAATTGSTTTATTDGTVAATTSAGSTSGPTPTTESPTTTSTTGSTTTSTAATTDQAPKPGDIKVRIFQLRQLAHTTIAGGRQPIDAFVADDEFKSGEGLMWVTDKDLKDSQGMFFVFPSPKIQSFWMQNTLIPLDIVYVATDGKVINIVHGKPRNETPLPSTAPAQYVLELKDGMAAKLGIGPGTKLTIPKDVKYRGTPEQQPGMSIPTG